MDDRDLQIPPFRELPRPNWFLIIGLVIGFLAIVAIWTSAFTVGPQSVGVVLRYGRFTRIASPGLNWKLPYPIEVVKKVPSRSRLLKEEFGFETKRAGVRSQFSRSNRLDESLMLTGDRNVVVVEWTTQYAIRDPQKYLFKLKNVEKTFRYMNESVMRRIVGDRSVNEVLTIGREEIELKVLEELQSLCDDYESGIEVREVLLQNVNPPDEVKASFDNVNKAQQERDSLINQAQAEFNREIPKARGNAERLIAEAQGYQLERINRARGEASAFGALLAQYELNPEVTRYFVFLEAMKNVLPRVEKKLIVDEDLKSLVPLMSIEPERGGRP